MALDPPPGYVKLFGALVPIKAPEMPAIANPPPPPPPEELRRPNPAPPALSPRVSGVKRRRSRSQRKTSRKWATLPPQPLPQKYRDFLLAMGVDDQSPIHHVYTRTLYESDVNDGQNRLHILPQQLLKPFLAPGEEDFLRRKDANKAPNKLRVKVVDPGLVVRTMTLAKWNCQEDGDPADTVTQGGEEKTTKKESGVYALISSWKDVVKVNDLVAGSSIQVWSFRINGELGFVIHKVPSHQQQAEGSISQKSVVLDGSSSSGSSANNGDDQGGHPGSSSSVVASA